MVRGVGGNRINNDDAPLFRFILHAFYEFRFERDSSASVVDRSCEVSTYLHIAPSFQHREKYLNGIN